MLLLGSLAAFLIWTKARRPGDDTRCSGTALGWKRWLLVVSLFGAGELPAADMSSIPGYEALLSSAQLAVPTERVGNFPWETNSLLAEVFGVPVRLEPDFKRPRIIHELVPLVVAESSSKTRSDNIKAQVLKAVPRIRPGTAHLSSNNPEAGRQQAINAWLEIIKLDLHESTVGRQILDILSRNHSKQDETRLVLETVELSVRNKSANTLIQRAAALAQYFSWAKPEGVQLLPFREQFSFEYVRSDIMKTRGATNATRFVEALNLVGGAFGFDGAFASATSSRVKGAAIDKHLQKNLCKAATELDDTQVFGLEQFLACPDNSAEDRVGAGAICFMIYSRTRHSDTQRLTEIYRDLGANDVGFIEAKAQGLKNSKTTELKTQLLPIVAPTKGLGFAVFGSWWINFEAARLEAGLRPVDDESYSNIVLWPRKDREGNWTNVSCTSDDYSDLLRKILSNLGWPADQLAGVSSHSCKATTLSFCSKFGVGEEERRILAYHLSKGSSTIKMYSRDVMVAPLRQMAK